MKRPRELHDYHNYKAHLEALCIWGNEKPWKNFIKIMMRIAAEEQLLSCELRMDV